MVAGETQTERLHTLLSDGEWHSTVEIMREVYGASHLGVARISARVWELRHSFGKRIDRMQVTSTIYAYRLNTDV